MAVGAADHQSLREGWILPYFLIKALKDTNQFVISKFLIFAHG